MTTTAFTLMFLPACLAVPAGLALGAVAEALLNRVGAAIMPPRAADAARPGRRPDGRGRDAGTKRPATAAHGDRRGPAWFGLCGALDAPRRDEPAYLKARGTAAPAPWM